MLWRIPFEATQGNNTTLVLDGQTVVYTGQGKGMFAVKIEQKRVFMRDRDSVTSWAIE